MENERERREAQPLSREELKRRGRHGAAGKERVSLVLFFPVVQTVIKRCGRRYH